MTSYDDIPQDVAEAARKVTQFFAEQNMHNWVIDGCVSRSADDHATLDHIPAVKALREENERLKVGVAHLQDELEGKVGYSIELPDGCMHECGEKVAKAYADLESQLAALQAGEPVVWCREWPTFTHYSGGIVYAGKSFWPEKISEGALGYYVDRATGENVLREYPLYTQAPASVQPTIAGKVPAMPDLIAFLKSVRHFEDQHGAPMSVDIDRWCAALSAQPISAIPPGYAVVPVDPTAAMHGAGDGVSGKCWMGGKVWRAMLASAPAIQPQAAERVDEQEKEVLCTAYAIWSNKAESYVKDGSLIAFFGESWRENYPEPEFEFRKVNYVLADDQGSK